MCPNLGRIFENEHEKSVPKGQDSSGYAPVIPHHMDTGKRRCAYYNAASTLLTIVCRADNAHRHTEIQKNDSLYRLSALLDFRCTLPKHNGMGSMRWKRG